MRDSDARTFYDITVVNTLTNQANANMNLATALSEGVVSVLNEAYRRKVDKHGADVARTGGRFVPLVVNTTGVWHPDSLTRLRELSRYALARNGSSESESWKALLTRLGCALARGNTLVLKTARLQMQPNVGNNEEEFEPGGAVRLDESDID